MQVQSLSYRTDLYFPAFEGLIVDHGAYLVIKTPKNPTFHWGNFLLFAEPPSKGDLVRWTELFRQEIGEPQQVGHAVFGVDGVAGDVGEAQEFLDAGFELDRGVVMTARTVTPPPRPNRDITVRPLTTDEEWLLAHERRSESPVSEQPDEGNETFRRRLMARYRAMSEAGLGHWYGAFLGDELIADLGLFHRGGVGRYQAVGTHPDFRGRGVAGTLVHAAAEHALDNAGLDLLVIVADEGSQAQRIYGSVGFKPVEKTVGFAWSAPTAPSPDTIP